VWALVEQTIEAKHDGDDEREFRDVVKKIPSEMRTFLNVMCVVEREPRTDGKWGHSVIDNLWQTFLTIKAGEDLIDMGASMSHSTNYL
jgi:hypothetical protein